MESGSFSVGLPRCWVAFLLEDRLRIKVDSLRVCDVPLNDLVNELEEKLKNKVKVKFVRFDGEKIEFSFYGNLSREVVKEIVERSLYDYVYYNSKNVFTGRVVFEIGDDIPLIGTDYFGLIDRGTNLIQVRPVTGCPLNCIYCSVDEGRFSKTRFLDYVVDLNHLVSEFERVVEFKGRFRIEAHIDGQGEPMTYPKIFKLIEELREVDGVEVISMQTNGIFLDRRSVRKLASSGIDRINVSLNSLKDLVCARLGGVPSYSVKKIIESIEYANDLGIHVLIAPVWLKGLNDEDIEEIILFAKENLIRVRDWPLLGIQNFEVYKHGRVPKNVKMIPFPRFYKKLRELERKYGIKPLKLRPSDFGIHRRRKIPKVFVRGEVDKFRIVAPGRMRGEFIGVSRGRSVKLVESKMDHALGDTIRAVIIHTKHNIYSAKPL
ncbi:MAG: radical SAM protein [Candidatus Asgardarchaeia archaeon]